MSDLDFQICFGGGETSKEVIYPRVIQELKSRTKRKTISNERVKDIEPGGEYNVINVYPEHGGKISFALEPCESFH